MPTVHAVNTSEVHFGVSASLELQSKRTVLKSLRQENLRNSLYYTMTKWKRTCDTVINLQELILHT